MSNRHCRDVDRSPFTSGPLLLLLSRQAKLTNNLTWLRQTGRRYIIGAPKAELKQFDAELADALTVHDGVEVNSHTILGLRRL